MDQRPNEGVRASDRDRDKAVVTLKRAYAQGALSLQEFEDRLGQALPATTVADLHRLTDDLSDHTTSFEPVPVIDVAEPRPSRWRLGLISVAATLVTLTGAGGFWLYHDVQQNQHHECMVMNPNTGLFHKTC